MGDNDGLPGSDRSHQNLHHPSALRRHRDGHLETPASILSPSTSQPVQVTGDRRTLAPSLPPRTSPSVRGNAGVLRIPAPSLPPLASPASQEDQSRDNDRMARREDEIDNPDPIKSRGGDLHCSKPPKGELIREVTAKKVAPVDNGLRGFLNREIGAVSRPKNSYPAFKGPTVPAPELKNLKRAIRSATLNFDVHFCIAPADVEDDTSFYHRLYCPMGWGANSLIRFGREGRRQATIRPPPFRIMPQSPWRDFVLSGFHCIQTKSLTEPLVISTPPASQPNNLPPDQQGYNFVTTQLKYEPRLSFQHCQKIVQAALYFGEPLAHMLNPRSIGSVPLSDKFSRHRFQAIDDVEAMGTNFHALSLYTGSNITWDQPLRIHVSPASHHAVEFYFQSHSNEQASLGTLLVEQLDILISFIEAALSAGGGRGHLQARYPATILGLGQFIKNRNMGMEEPAEDGKSLVKMPFISSLSKEERMARCIVIAGSWEDSETPKTWWTPARGYARYDGPRQYEPRGHTNSQSRAFIRLP